MTHQGQKKLSGALAMASTIIMGAITAGLVTDAYRIKLVSFTAWALHMITTQLAPLFGDVPAEKTIEAPPDRVVPEPVAKDVKP